MNSLTQEVLDRIDRLPQPHLFYKRSGIHRQTVYNWRIRRQEPSLALLEAAVNALGGELRIVWK